MPSASFSTRRSANANAQTYKASSIVLPKLGDMREIVQSEIQPIAEAKCPGSVEVQQKYTPSSFKKSFLNSKA
ncbi:hypothetical protein [Nostoc sp.]|uniref:hypothetical protein n=1 Tax=Nostoc sp. TaxID=1180 RepID=UPI002FF76862